LSITLTGTPAAWAAQKKAFASASVSQSATARAAAGKISVRHHGALGPQIEEDGQGREGAHALRALAGAGGAV
jgi:hypothetical protein